MCFYDQIKFEGCGDYKWSHFREHCEKEHRIGETCGMKLVLNTNNESGKCKICTTIDRKTARIEKEKGRIGRWNRENSRKASIEVSEEVIAELQREVDELWRLKQMRTL
jgi:hypothetical protein